MWRGNNNVEYEGKQNLTTTRREEGEKDEQDQGRSLPILELVAAILGRPGTAMVAAAVVAPAAAETVNFLLFYK